MLLKSSWDHAYRPRLEPAPLLATLVEPDLSNCAL